MQQINRLLSSSAGLVSETHLLVCSLSEATAGVCAESVTISCSSGVVSLLTVSIEPDNHILIQGSVLKEQNNPLTRCIRHENIAAPCAIFLSLPLWNTFCLLYWYFLIQRGELMVYFDRTRTGDLWRTNRKCFGEYFFRFCRVWSVFFREWNDYFPVWCNYNVNLSLETVQNTFSLSFPLPDENKLSWH